MKKNIISSICLIILSILSINTAAGDNGEQSQETEVTAPQLSDDRQEMEVTETEVLPNSVYRIGAGDVLNLSVWRDEAMSRQVVVLPDGTVSFPLIGQIIAAGKSVGELEQEIIRRIKRYQPEPVLDVSVLTVNSMLIYVIGKVRNPGRFPVQSDVNVLQALAMAGGLDKHADEDDIKIYRRENNQDTFLSFEYDEVIDGDNLEQNIQLQRGDVVVVP